MKNKYFKTVLLSLILTLTVMLSPILVDAQPQGLQVVLIPYESLEDVPNLYSMSTHPMYYYMGEGVAHPVFLAIVTEEQKKEMESLGYEPQVVDSNAGEINQYYSLSSSEPNHISQLQNNSLKQQGVEIAVPITEYETLIKLPAGKTIRDIKSPELNNFEKRRFAFDMKLSPALQTMATEQAANKNELAPTSNSPLYIILSLAVVIGIAVFIFYRQKRSR